MDLERLDIWQSLLCALPVAGLVVLLSQFCGRLTLVAVGWPPANRPAEWIDFHFANALGMNIVGLVALATSLLPVVIRYGVILLLIVMAVAWAAVNYVRNGFDSLKNWRSGVQHRGVWLCGLPLLFTLGPALAYPSGWDELTYHLELPRRWFLSDQLSVYPDLPYSALPSLLETVFTVTYPIESLILPRFLVWVIWINGIVVFYAAVKQVCLAANAALLTLALAVSPMGLMISANCYVETLIWANMAAILWLSLARSSESDSDWPRSILMGILIGGCVAIKMTSVGLVCLPWLLMLTSPKLHWRQALVASLCAGALAGPFYLRTWLQTGNPVSPFYAQWFTDDPAWIQCSQYHHELAVSNFGVRGLSGLLICPVALAMANEIYDGTLGWQWLLLLLLLAVATVRCLKKNHPHWSLLRLCLLAALLCYALWFATSQQVRFAVPLFMIVIVTAGVGLETYALPIQRWGRWAILVLSLLSVPWSHVGYYLDSWCCVLKIRTPKDYIRDGVTDSYAELVLALHEQVPADARILSLFEHRLAYMPAGVEIGTPHFQTKYFRQPAQETADSLMNELRSHGIRYLILTTKTLGPDISPLHIEQQQNWFARVDECIAAGRLKIVWKSEYHGLAEVVDP